MRDILLTLFVFGSIPFILSRPRVGVYMWSWLSYMNPHRLTWGFAYSMPFAQVVALATLISFLFAKQGKHFPNNMVTRLWMLLLVWMCITTIFAMYPDDAWEKLIKVAKVQLFTVITIMIISSKRHLDMLIWVIVLSIGYYSVKGGVFTIQTLGAHRVWGPPGSYIEDNNALAVASIMIIPLMFYLRNQAEKVWVKHVLLGMMLLTLISAVGSYSRSALVASGATGFFLWLKTPNKMVSGMIMLLLAVGVLMFMPDAWHERMDTIINYQEEGSAMSRIITWKMAWNVGIQEFFGAGFNFWGPEAFQLYDPDPANWHKRTAAHSIYFTMLGEHGWIGLLLFFFVFLSTWRMASRLAWQCKDNKELLWIRDLALLLQVSLVAYASGGAFLNLAYFDLPWHLMSIVLITGVIYKKHQQKTVEGSL